jgi:hypothetical protein
MFRGLALVLAGLAAGFAIAWWQQPAVAPSSAVIAGFGDTAEGTLRPASASADIARLTAALDAERGERAALAARVDELAAALDAVAQAGAATAQRPEPAAAATQPESAVPAGPPRFRGGFDPRGESQESRAERLVAAGFAPDRAEWIARRTAELRVAQMQAQYAAAREGKPFDPAAIQGGEATLRSELGDADYERYLTALNRPTSVAVREVLASSPGERAGLIAGDEVVAYDGKRVFDLRDLNVLTLEGSAGESVAVQVRRDGQLVNLTMPRGPIGIFGGGFRGR